jgi:transcriptional regulator with PAS, ATPase and Fis domain
MVSLDKTTFDAPADGASPDGPRAYVSVAEGPASPLIVDLPRGAEVAIGRSRSSAVFVDDGAVSRTHATLRWDGGGTVVLTDYGSRNGTIVDARRVRGSVSLGSGSEIVVGGARLVLVIAGARTSGVDLEREPSGGILARDPAMLRVIALAERAAQSDAPVLLVGETGVGKEVLARHVHAVSRRADRPFLAVAAGALGPGTAEATLFGWERGAFTGADEPRPGIFEAVAGGTLFLDEVAELSPATQARLLRVLQNKEVMRVGGVTPITVDFRLVSATVKDVSDEAIFRRDLLYRIGTIRIDLPPLRVRRDDVLPLAERFLVEHAPGLDLRFAPDALAALSHHEWPGNVRELENAVVRAVAVREGPAIRAHDLFEEPDRRDPDGNLKRHVHDVERDAIVRALEEAGGNQTRAAGRLGISRRALIYRMEKLGLKAPPPSQRG